MPAPARQRVFSASRTQEKGVVMRSPLGVERSLGGSRGGWQVARVKWSTSLRMKKRGKVPPRLETLLEEAGGSVGGILEKGLGDVYRQQGRKS